MNNIQKYIHQNTLYDSSLNYYIACSSGVDSTLLLATFKSLGYNVTAIHVNYNLRGQDSIEDAEFLKDYTKKHDIRFIKKEIHLNDELKNGGNLQEKARDYRYNWFKEILAESSLNRIVLGHHLNDQIETFWMNICRNSGVLGLACMQENQNSIFRPLLNFKKNEIIEIAKTESLIWREDVSNQSIKYKRNFFRNEVVPYLDSEFSNIDSDIALLIQAFQSKQKELERRIAQVTEIVLKENTLSFSEFQSLDDFELNEFARTIGLSYPHIERVKELISSENGKKLLINEGEFKSIVKHENSFEFCKREGQNAPEIQFESVSVLPETFSKNEIYLNQDEIQGELKLRKWSKGDRIASVGMNGTQLISDILKDAKISTYKKENVYVLTDDVNIHWCLNYKIGRLAVASSKTDVITKCTI